MNLLDGKVAVITGAASGMGLATAETFVEHGAKVVLADIQEERGAAAAARLDDSALFVRTDVTVAAQASPPSEPRWTPSAASMSCSAMPVPPWISRRSTTSLRRDSTARWR
nr:SDR family NAD(P)-dependent oxidoreductase [Nocardia sp. CC227C]